ncbi:glycosyltransferase family 2 protein [Polynucleobacter sp. es-GGE-1]|uniref:glycosyltransferase family 2 protein n=1 Tax=Polynucleobacter sp. es-GGE-1 TaxID=1819724 RepID=UPI001C0BB118|nr:glycosyltransferase family 2 protein [Polynucleobacter sp. es-GGE-1]MBU3635954.1 glycosyltransferase family 2 protein [Polynucleobacter sp. es-GGE-1]
MTTISFKSVSVILPVMNETYSLVETVDQILRHSKEDVRNFIIVVAEKTTQEALSTIDALIARHGSLIILHRQKMPFIGGAMREAFELVESSHAIMMASDLETDPNLVPLLIAKSREFPQKIVTVTRWIKGGGFQDYSNIKLLANWIFQKMFSLLYWTKLTDMTYAYRIFPTPILKSVNWQELRHPFLFETIIKPLRIGIEAIEIPGFWRARTEGESQNTFLRNFEYFKIGLKVRFMSKNKILKID